jgi:hypothetical protein
MTVPFNVHRLTLIEPPRERRRNLSARCDTYLEAAIIEAVPRYVVNLAKLCTVRLTNKRSTAHI